ncbi:helix-turn-helix domain-containing protein [Streptomyces sp. NPDC001380]|uniref:AraC family transcriptional regulator n=1 Tax=Streptomyces sp. NPDC001380 TaxID=3364566 RepID=UPI0036C7A445
MGPLREAAGEPVADTAAGLPCAALRPLVHRYVGYRYRGFPPGVHLGLPSPHLTVVVSLGAPVRVALRPDGEPRLHASLAGGLHVRPVLLPHDGEQYGVQLELTPYGARALFGAPAAELAASVVDLPELLGGAAALLPERLAREPDWAGRFALLDALLARRADPAAAPRPELAHAWRRLTRPGGPGTAGDGPPAAGGPVAGGPVAGVARELGWSRRHLSGRFTAEFGLSPTAAVRVARFHRSRRLLQRPGPRTLAAVAAACGYFDQAHMAREWRGLAGMPASAWLAAGEPPVPGDG